ncbi:hypothetical protein Bbelb_435100 [Branchiostoma belcheri]|nr:hypothetical protein Bbelb_437860 [Branchiostoma belcheri]KAI8478756.1 hypothetical protein Bbelb_435100 [Branchiostoma belcheri]
MKLLPLRPRRSASPPPHDFRVDCELCRHWGLSRRTGAKQNCAGGVEERRGRSRFFAGAKQNGAGAKQNGGGEEEGVSWGFESLPRKAKLPGLQLIDTAGEDDVIAEGHPTSKGGHTKDFFRLRYLRQVSNTLTTSTGHPTDTVLLTSRETEGSIPPTD